MKISTSILNLAYLFYTGANVIGGDDSPVYGVDVSFPMHHASASKNYEWLPHNLDQSIETPEEYKDMAVQPLGDRQTFYDNMIQGCVDYYGKSGELCLANERDRILMASRQPKGVYNYTKLGYTKIRAPENVFKLIKDFWEANKDKHILEELGKGNTYLNHWSSPTYMTSVGNETLGGGHILKQKIWDAARDGISEWTGQTLVQCSLYGIRIYTEGSVLSTHVDRLPLVSSAIINVDQDVDEPWPLEVIGHDGIAVNITMVPGDLVLYESHSILHGRPFPLKGRFMANIFVHFEPVGEVGSEFSIDPDLPKYIIRGSEEEKHWRKANPGGYSVQKPESYYHVDKEIHEAVKEGNVEEIKAMLNGNSSLVDKRDKNQWTPLHEAVRIGDVKAMATLLDHGADINARTKGRGGTFTGPSPFWWAMYFHGENHDAVKLLSSRGAKFIGQGDKTEL